MTELMIVSRQKRYLSKVLLTLLCISSCSMPAMVASLCKEGIRSYVKGRYGIPQ